MTNWQRYLGVSVGVALVVTWLSMTGAGPALAQGALKPTAAQVRVPYSYDKVGDCNNVVCYMYFPEVPAGKLLIIEHFSAVAQPGSSATIVDYAELLTNNTELGDAIRVRHYFAMTLIGQQGSSSPGNTWGANQAVLAFVKAGSSPQVSLNTRDGGNIFYSQVTLSGYLIDAP